MKAKRSISTLVLGLFVVLLSLSTISCVSLLAGMLGIEVDPPASEDSSLLFVELIAYTEGQSGVRDDDLVDNNFFSGFFPVVLDQTGNELSFENIDAMTEAGLVFHHANLDPGTYTLKGFRYLWMTDYNFLNSPIRDLKFDGQRKDEFIETEFLPLPEPIYITVEPGTVHTLGVYELYYELQETLYQRNPEMPRQDDAYKLVDYSYQHINPDDPHLLALMTEWQHPAWIEWNKRNPLK